MSVKLRLRRMGKKKNPFYRVVVADSRAPRDGRIIESIGTYNPLTNPFQVELKEDRVYYWLGNGAQPTRTVKNLFQKKGLWLKWDLMRNGADEAKIVEEFTKWQALQDAREQRIAAEKDKKVKAQKEAEEKVAAEAEAQEKAAAEAEAAKLAEAEAAKKAEEAKAAEAQKETEAEEVANAESAPLEEVKENQEEAEDK